jgi:DNA mismatch endonuclease (patch repair protein)
MVTLHLPASAHFKTRCAVNYPHPTTPAVTAVMRANTRRDTRPERRLRSLLHERGYRYRCDYPIEFQDGRVRVDLAFPAKKVAVFVDGCFWHGCDIHGTSPRANRSYWISKLARNRERDRRVDERLVASGWNVVRIWEHMPPPEAADLVGNAISRGPVKRVDRTTVP